MCYRLILFCYKSFYSFIHDMLLYLSFTILGYQGLLLVSDLL